MAYDFKGKKALVTGGARGIGKQIVKNLVKYNAEVVALDINKDNLDALKNEIPSVHTVCVDLSNWTAARNAVEELGVIDLLVNNAGIVMRATIEEVTEADLDRHFAVNVKPIVNISQVIVKALKKHGKEGAIVNTSSLAAIAYVDSMVAYSTSKAAVDKLTKTMAVELAPYGIRVNAVRPTVVLTELTTSVATEEELEKYRNDTPLKKHAETEDIAAAVTFLLSDQSKMITGTCLLVDGGYAVA